MSKLDPCDTSVFDPVEVGKLVLKEVATRFVKGKARKCDLKALTKEVLAAKGFQEDPTKY